MLNKIEKYLYVFSPILILSSLFYYYFTSSFKLFSAVTLVAGTVIGIIFFVRFYDDIVRKITKRKVKYGVNSVIVTLVVLGLVVIIYMVLMDHNRVFDLTKTKKFTLSDQTVKVLEKFEGPVRAFAFYTKKQDTTSIRILFNEYHYHYKDFDFKIIDPDLNPGEVKNMGIDEYGQVVIEYSGKKEKIRVNNEEGITNALIKLSQTGVKKVYFVTGHGEHGIEDSGNEGYDRINAAINAENYNTEEILIVREDKIPDDCAVLIAAGPQGDYDTHEMKLLDNYIQDGGRIFFLIDPNKKGDPYTNISAFLKRYCLILGNDVIIDPLSRVLAADCFMPVIENYTSNPITKNFRLATFLRFARSISVERDCGKDILTREVAKTGEASWAETNLKDLFTGKKEKFDEGLDTKGPVTVMAYSRITLPEKKGRDEREEAGRSEERSKKKEALILVASDSDFVTNSMYRTQGNKDLFLNAINHLADRGDIISIRPKQQEIVLLTMTAKQGKIVFFVFLIVIPLFVIVSGIVITIQRRLKS